MRKRLSEIQGLLELNLFVANILMRLVVDKNKIAIARALITKPDLYWQMSQQVHWIQNHQMILDLFTKINKLGQTILMVTHSVKAASFSNRVIFIKDGVVRLKVP